MAKKRRISKEEGAMTKTTLRINHEVWRAARIRALDERVGFQHIVDRALRLYLKMPKGGGR